MMPSDVVNLTASCNMFPSVSPPSSSPGIENGNGHHLRSEQIRIGQAAHFRVDAETRYIGIHLFLSALSGCTDASLFNAENEAARISQSKSLNPVFFENNFPYPAGLAIPESSVSLSFADPRFAHYLLMAPESMIINEHVKQRAFIGRKKGAFIRLKNEAISGKHCDISCRLFCGSDDKKTENGHGALRVGEIATPIIGKIFEMLASRGIHLVGQGQSVPEGICFARSVLMRIGSSCTQLASSSGRTSPNNPGSQHRGVVSADVGNLRMLSDGVFAWRGRQLRIDIQGLLQLAAGSVTETSPLYSAAAFLVAAGVDSQISDAKTKVLEVEVTDHSTNGLWVGGREAKQMQAIQWPIDEELSLAKSPRDVGPQIAAFRWFYEFSVCSEVQCTAGPCSCGVDESPPTDEELELSSAAAAGLNFKLSPRTVGNELRRSSVASASAASGSITLESPHVGASDGRFEVSSYSFQQQRKLEQNDPQQHPIFARIVSESHQQSKIADWPGYEQSPVALPGTVRPQQSQAQGSPRLAESSQKGLVHQSRDISGKRSQQPSNLGTQDQQKFSSEVSNCVNGAPTSGIGGMSKNTVVLRRPSQGGVTAVVSRAEKASATEVFKTNDMSDRAMDIDATADDADLGCMYSGGIDSSSTSMIRSSVEKLRRNAVSVPGPAFQPSIPKTSESDVQSNSDTSYLKLSSRRTSSGSRLAATLQRLMDDKRRLEDEVQQLLLENEELTNELQATQDENEANAKSLAGKLNNLQLEKEAEIKAKEEVSAALQATQKEAETLSKQLTEMQASNDELNKRVTNLSILVEKQRDMLRRWASWQRQGLSIIKDSDDLLIEDISGVGICKLKEVEVDGDVSLKIKRRRVPGDGTEVMLSGGSHGFIELPGTGQCEITNMAKGSQTSDGLRDLAGVSFDTNSQVPTSTERWGNSLQK